MVSKDLPETEFGQTSDYILFIEEYAIQLCGATLIVQSKIITVIMQSKIITTTNTRDATLYSFISVVMVVLGIHLMLLEIRLLKTGLVNTQQCTASRRGWIKVQVGALLLLTSFMSRVVHLPTSHICNAFKQLGWYLVDNDEKLTYSAPDTNKQIADHEGLPTWPRSRRSDRSFLGRTSAMYNWRL